MKHKIKIFACSLLCFAVTNIFAQNNRDLYVKFIKGNISDKTAAVKEANGESAAWLSQTAINFALENKNILSGDRDLAALAVAGVFSLPEDYFSRLSGIQKNELEQKLSEIFESFTDNTVKIAVVDKTAQIAKHLESTSLVRTFNNFVINASPNDISVLQKTVNTLAKIGNTDSFNAVYSMYERGNFSSIAKDLENTIAALAPASADTIYNIIVSSDIGKIRPIFDIVEKKVKNNENLRAEIAENVLFVTIYKAGNKEQSSETLSLQMDALQVLKDLSWTRASQTAISFFDIAADAYDAVKISEDDFGKIIANIAALSPIEASQKLSAYLSELNSTKEHNNASSDKIVRTVIETLGSLGNKMAFDSLLAVTYLDYSEDIIALARDSLARLRW